MCPLRSLLLFLAASGAVQKAFIGIYGVVNFSGLAAF